MLKHSVISRRDMLYGLSLATSALLIPRISSSQDITVPEVETTLDFLSSQTSMRLLNTQFLFAYELATLALVQFDTNGLGDDEGLQSVLRQDANRSELFQRLFQMASPDGESLRETAIERISDQGDPLNGDLEEHLSLKTNYLSIVAETGLNAEADIVQSSADSLTHIERISRVLLNRLSLCNIFPFSTQRFCEAP